MAKFRDDLKGAVILGGASYYAGDDVPEGFAVGGHLTDDGRDYGFPEPAASPEGEGEGGSQVGEPLTDDEAARAAELGLPEDASPDYVRGALDGYDNGRREGEAQGSDAARARVLAEAARGTTLNVADVTVEQIEAHLAEHPEETAAVLAAEAASERPRKGILARFLGED